MADRSLKDLRACWPYYGNKRQAAQLINSLLGDDVKNVVVPFAGALGEFLVRAPAQVETVNDLDGLVVNAWRAIKYSPERVALLCDEPVHEVTLHARHDELVRARTTKGKRKRALKSGRRRHVPLAEYLRSSDRSHDVRLAAQWIWGASCWLGSGWCRDPVKKIPRLCGQGGQPHPGLGVARPRSTKRQVPRLSGGGGHPGLGSGVHARSGVGRTWRTRPHLSHRGQGVTAPGAHTDALIEWMEALSYRLRWTRIICGDWTRAVTKAVTTSHGLTAVSLDPTYDHGLRSTRIYRKDDPGISPAVRAWARERGGDRKLRITLAGKWEEHDELLEHGWTRHPWRDDGEVIWASPHCLRSEFGPLFDRK